MSTDPAEKEMFKQAFYLITVEAYKWPHWGPGHFLNCADAAAPYALGFDESGDLDGAMVKVSEEINKLF